MRVPLIRGIIFDHDGTLVDSLPVVVAATNAVLRQHGFPEHPAQEIVAAMVLPTIPRMLSHTGRTDPVLGGQLAQDFYREANRLPHLACVYPGVPEALADLARRGTRMGMVSNNQGAFIRVVGSRLGLLQYLPIVLGEEDMPQPKPDPRGLLQAAAGLGLAPSECLFVGDSPFDAQAATAAGMRPVGCTWGIHPRAEMDAMGFAVLIDHPRELLGLG